MQHKKISQKLLQNFGIKGLGFYWSKTCDDRKEFVKECIRDNQMLAIVGDVGIGKSTLFDKVKGEMSADTVFIYCADPLKEQMAVGSVLRDGIATFTADTIRGIRSARKLQFERVVGAEHVRAGKNICFVIEEAHRVNATLFRSLKELRESEYLGVSPFFSVVLLGHGLLSHKMETIKEARWRSHILELDESHGWLNYDERVEFLRTVFGSALSVNVRRRIAALIRKPLEMMFFVETKMWEAYYAGKSKLDDEVVQPTAKELYDAVKVSHPDGISYKIIAEEIAEMGKPVSKTAVHDVMNSGNDHPKSKLVRQAIERVNKRQEDITYSKVATGTGY